ncbi:hypothetical protein ARMGADRAFT_646825 [Armillaria gallica]|uniref:Uncharacterized protein n=1 Tax=Armillaria gallica TaxID=47427 RepID=A0A2H3DQZ4_ARMGA|nr:hypothetical protein ARMGADRAFT_646825 [Armillaria gallica]
MLSTMTLPTISLTEVNISLPYPILRKRQSASTVTADTITRPVPVKYSARSIFSARRPSEHPGAPTPVNTASLSFVNLRSKYQTASIITTDTISRPIIRVKRSAQSIFKVKERRNRSQHPVELTDENMVSRPSVTHRSKSQSATANTYMISRPVLLVKRSAQSIFKVKKPKDHSHESDIMTIKELDDVISLHPRSEYSRYPNVSFPNRRKFTRGEDSDVSLSSESSSLLYDQSQTSSASSTVVSDSPLSNSVLSDSVLSESSRTTSAESLNLDLTQSLPSACVPSAVLVLPESPAHTNSFKEVFRWMVMMLMVIIAGFVAGFYFGDIKDILAFLSSYL